MSCFFFFFFWSVRKNILKEPQENKRPTKEYRGGHKQRENTRENKKQTEQKKLNTMKRTKEHRDRITRGESPSPRPIKKRATKISEQLVIGFVPVLKSAPVSLPPNTPH